VNLVLLESGDIDDNGVVRLAGPRAAHIIQVLKAALDDDVRVGVLDGGIGVGRVISMGDGIVTMRCDIAAGIPPRPVVDVLLALPRPKVMRRLWAQIAALGVGQVILTNASRVERNYFDTHVLGEACYRPLLIEGLQQARDTRVPGVSIHRQLKVLIEDDLDALFPQGLRLAAQPGAVASVTSATRGHAGERVLLAIGPEGGWTAFELGLLEAHGFQAAAMGARALRSDTACVALLALVHEALDRN
jgi:16S rRNA (uracil1498-N3)-methyltransferase